MRTPLAYRLITRVGVPLVPVVLSSEQERHAHRERLRAAQSMEAWARVHRDIDRPLLWFHASSVGEGLQASAVMAALRTLLPNAQIAYTHFSASATRFAESLDVDYHGYFPYDRAAQVTQALKALRPTALIFTKADLWPELAVSAAERGVRVGIIAATVRAGSGRLRWPMRQLTHAGYRAVSYAGAISPQDGARLEELGVPGDRIAIVGDPRIDSALRIADAAGETANWPGADQRLVAGSTWPQDERVLLAAFGQVRAAHPEASLLIVPHQPTASHLEQLDELASSHSFATPVRNDGKSPPRDTLAVVDRVGVLASLYRHGIAAYVGGGFGNRGLHSVLEPAAASRNVAIGPNHRGSPDAELLAAAGALIQLNSSDPVADLARWWKAVLDDPSRAGDAGRKGRQALEASAGAAQRCAHDIAALVQQATATL